MFLFGCVVQSFGECLYYISVHCGSPSVVHYTSHYAPFFYSEKKTTAILEEVAKQRVLDREKKIIWKQLNYFHKASTHEFQD